MRTVLAVCDDGLFGKVYKGKRGRLDLVLYQSFYQGDLVSFEEAVVLLKTAESINLVGRDSIKAAQAAFEVSRTAVKKIGGIPHLQLYKV